jgi:MerR family transcriptional regulator, light-induced transcriptional regulator
LETSILNNKPKKTYTQNENGNMNAISDTPAFNLKVVLQETGIKPDTIRAWERRYGLPEPDRTAGGHRLYSQRDIEMIKWLMTRQDEGMSISRAVNLWRSIEAEGKDPLGDQAFQVAGAGSLPTKEFSTGAALDEIRQSWVEACLNFDETRAEAILTQAFALYPVEIACTEVLQKGLAKIGQGWYQGQTSVQQEHFSSALALRKLNTLISASPMPYHKERIIVACPPEEDHTFSALMITLFLRQRGWPVVYLGANVPLLELHQTIDKLKPSLLVLPAQQLYTAARLAEIAHEINHQVPIAFGGLIFNLVPELRQFIPGYFIGEELTHVATTIEQLVHQKPPKPDVQLAAAEYRGALTHFRDQQAAIEAGTWEQLSSNGIERKHLMIANLHFTQDIEAALMLGDMSLLANEIDWLEGLLANYKVHPIGLRHYLETFQAVAEKELDERGTIVIDWLYNILTGESTI